MRDFSLKLRPIYRHRSLAVPANRVSWRSHVIANNPVGFRRGVDVNKRLEHKCGRPMHEVKSLFKLLRSK